MASYYAERRSPKEAALLYLHKVYAPSRLQVTSDDVAYLRKNPFEAPGLFRVELVESSLRFTYLEKVGCPAINLSRALTPDRKVDTCTVPGAQVGCGHWVFASKHQVPERWMAMLADFGFRKPVQNYTRERRDDDGPLTFKSESKIEDIELKRISEIYTSGGFWFQVLKGPIVTKQDSLTRSESIKFLVSENDVGASKFELRDGHFSPSARVAFKSCKGFHSTFNKMATYPYQVLYACEGGVTYRTKYQSEFMDMRRCVGDVDQEPTAKRLYSGRRVPPEEVVVLYLALKRVGCTMGPVMFGFSGDWIYPTTD